METVKKKMGRKPRDFQATKITPELRPEALSDLEWLQSYFQQVDGLNRPPSQGAIIGEALKTMRGIVSETAEAGKAE